MLKLPASRSLRHAAGAYRAAASTTRSLSSASLTPYQILDVGFGASEAEIKKAYRAKVKTLHPDVNPSDEAAAQFQAVQNAYEELTSAQNSTASRLPKGRHGTAYSVEELNERAERFRRTRMGSASRVATADNINAAWIFLLAVPILLMVRAQSSLLWTPWFYTCPARRLCAQCPTRAPEGRTTQTRSECKPGGTPCTSSSAAAQYCVPDRVSFAAVQKPSVGDPRPVEPRVPGEPQHHTHGASQPSQCPHSCCGVPSSIVCSKDLTAEGWFDEGGGCRGPSSRQTLRMDLTAEGWFDEGGGLQRPLQPTNSAHGPDG